MKSMMPGMVMSRTSTVDTSIHAVFAPSKDGLSPAARAATGAAARARNRPKVVRWLIRIAEMAKG